jgi:trans-aconitate methyltransferase
MPTLARRAGAVLVELPVIDYAARVLLRSPARQWENYGLRDPYFGVLSAECYRREKLTPESLERFYATGEQHVDTLLSELQAHPRTALDFGCGTGRVLVALARRCEHVVGVDISPAMLDECRSACAGRGIDNVTLTTVLPSGSFDLIHTVLVLQHIPARDGYRHVERLLGALAPGGAIALQVTLPSGVLTQSFYTAINLPLAANVWNLVRGRPWTYPSMQMNGYRLERILRLLADRGCTRSTIMFDRSRRMHELDSAFILAKLPPTTNPSSWRRPGDAKA